MTIAIGRPDVLPAAAARRRARRRGRLQVLAFLSPWLIGFVLFFAYPLIATFYFSFTRYDLLSPPIFVGLRNYRYLFTEDPNVWQAVRNTAWLVVVMVPLQVIFALAVAAIAIRIRRGAGVFRTLCYLPYLVPPVAGTIGFVFLLNPATGPVNKLLGDVGISAPNWFNDPHWAKPALVLLALWSVGELMVIFMASLLDVPNELYEAAALDGANSLQRFRYVTLPTISPVILFAAVTGVIATLQYFTEAMVASEVASGVTDLPGSTMTPGYPQGATLTFPQWIYDEAFRQYNMGYASALAVLLFVAAIAFTAILLKHRSGFSGGGAS